MLIYPHADAEIVSPLDVHIHHEVPSNQTPTLLSVPVSVIPESSPVFTAIPKSLPSLSPLPLLTTPTPPPTIATINPLSTLPDFASVFQFNDKITALEKEVGRKPEKKTMNFLSEHSLARIKEQVKDQLPQILPKEVSNFAPPVIEALIKESRDEVTLAKVSSQPHSTYEAASTLTEFELKKILIDKMEKRLAFRLLEGTRSNFAKLEYAFEECYKALSEKLDWENPKGGDYPFDLSKPLPLVMRGNCQIVPVDYFINNDLKYLQGGVSTMTYTTSTTKTKAAQYDLPGIEDMINDIEDMLIFVVQNRLTNLSGNDVADFAIALRMLTRDLIIQRESRIFNLSRIKNRSTSPSLILQDQISEKGTRTLHTKTLKDSFIHYQEYRHEVLAKEKMEHIGKEKSSFHDQGHQQAAKGKEDDEEFGEIC
ncbi:hypothetical protein Tco_0898796 [Tanacetum coccineum]